MSNRAHNVRNFETKGMQFVVAETWPRWFGICYPQAMMSPEKYLVSKHLEDHVCNLYLYVWSQSAHISDLISTAKHSPSEKHNWYKLGIIVHSASTAAALSTTVNRSWFPDLAFISVCTKFLYSYRKSCEESLSQLGCGYLDLLLVHWPDAFKHGTEEKDDVHIKDTWSVLCSNSDGCLWPEDLWYLSCTRHEYSKLMLTAMHWD